MTMYTLDPDRVLFDAAEMEQAIAERDEALRARDIAMRARDAANESLAKSLPDVADEIVRLCRERDAEMKRAEFAERYMFSLIREITDATGVDPGPQNVLETAVMSLRAVAPELAALRRIDAEGLEVQSHPLAACEQRWLITRPGMLATFRGATLAEALAAFDRSKESR